MEVTMNIDDLLAAAFANSQKAESNAGIPSHMIGSYVIVRCRDAGVHAGVLTWASGRQCLLESARRLWYWKPKDGGSFLSAVAREGLHADSKVGTPVTVLLTENCEIIKCDPQAQSSIEEHPGYKK